MRKDRLGLFVLMTAGLWAAGCADDTWKCSDCGPGSLCDEQAHKCIDQSDTDCGRLGNACQNGTHCVGGQCLCGSGETAVVCNFVCDSGICADTKNDRDNCGTVGHRCDPGWICYMGECSADCPNEQVMCKTGTTSKCADLDSDREHCGDCSTACPDANDALHIARGSCVYGGCEITCSQGYEDADGEISNGCEKAVVTTATCGNGLVEAGELCDGSRLNDQTCETVVGAGSKGTLRCLPGCGGFDSSECSAPTTCGNGQLDGREVCDGRQLGNATCATVVGTGSTGVLLCGENCGEFDTSGCSAPTTCGNKAIDAGEVCDGSLLNGATCATVVGAGSTGTVTCHDNCSGYDISHCTAASVCGNGILEPGEECDGSNFNGETCESLNGMGSKGTLACDSTCHISVAQCSAPSTCGNGSIDANEVCDALLLNGATCATVVGAGSTGILRCASNCSGYDISGCTAAATCGNGLIETGEVCDGARLNDATCATINGAGSTGTLRCNATCSGYDTSGCTASTTCGNGIIESGEVCDGAQLNGATCNSQVGAGSKGNVLCADNCKSYDLSGCSAASTCGNNNIDANEQCDGGKLGGATCESVVGKGSTGTLKCGNGCQFDTSGCSASQYCGDGNIQSGEVCDSTNVSGLTCAIVVGYGSKGTLKCNSNCTDYDTTQCSAEVTCGNGRLDAGEVCDGSMLNGATCSARVGNGSTGTLKCNDSCSGYDTTGCSPANPCGNGSLDSGEICDGAMLNGATCASVVGFGSTGFLACNSTCSGYDKSGCSAANPCGNGSIDAGEQCDTHNMNGETCESIVGVGSTGTLACDSTCRFNTTDCTASRGCGNGSIEDSEECDGTSYKNDIKLCSAYDGDLYKSGSLKCQSNCKIDTSSCVSYCGDGVANVSKGEVCDGENLNKKTCASIVGPGSEGTLKCTADCRSFDTSGCTEPRYCGDGKINVDGEACDLTVFSIGSDDCAAYSTTYASGKLSCRSNCTVDVSACVAKTYCGDGKVNNEELCDGTSFLNNRTNCATWNPDKYTDGKVTCNSDCSLNYSACTEKPTVSCGNGKIDSGETCDGTNLNGYTCQTWGPDEFSGGTLSCNSSCQIDDSACTPIARCGDGIVNQASEECDGSEFANNVSSCNAYNSAIYQTGSLKCTADCRIDTSSCTAWCGNGSVNSAPGEVCDTAKTVTRTCAAELGTGYSGTLKCASDCKSYDTSDCIAPYCGDGTVNQTSENCDGTKFRNNKTTCTGWNSTAYTSGHVSCNDDCTINYDDCVAKAEVKCGDGVVNQASEECDGTQFKNNVTTCAAYDSKYSSGSLKCNSSCSVDTSSCVLAPVTNCGNNILDDDELCDGSLFYDNTKTCAAYNSNLYASGNLKCTDCDIDTSACKVHTCGDGVLASDELCDGTQFNPLFDTCKKINTRFSNTGSLSCDSNCNIVTTNCTDACGDGVLDDNEYCDGTLFKPDMASCSDWIVDSVGTLVCTNTCDIDYSGCKAPETAYCGDGIVNQAWEKCDGGNFANGNNTCLLYSSAYSSGLLGCNSDCTINTDNCVKSQNVVCGNYKLDGNEECDGTEFLFGIKTCRDYSPTYSDDQYGMLKCTDDCLIDDSACTRNCVENDLRCVTDNGTEKLLGCENGKWVTEYTCTSAQYCSITNEDFGCKNKPVDPVDLQWCTFHWLTEANNSAQAAYGRILLPNGKTSDDLFAYMLCTTDINKPVSEWQDAGEAHVNQSCSDCGANVEFMIDEPYTGYQGINYCTFIFDFLDEGMFACRPQQTGASEPILILEGSTTLTSDLTRKFTSITCAEGNVRCSGNLLQMCMDASWAVVQQCSSSDTCNATDEKCDEASVSYDNTITMEGLTSGSYAKSNTVEFSDGSVATLTGMINTSTNNSSQRINGDTLALKGSNGSYISITGLTSGLGTLSFTYRSWGSSDAATMTISDGSTSETLSVTKAMTTNQTYSHTFNNAAAVQVTISPSGSGRILIDDIRFTSAQ